jgi:hypothetical protein
MDFREHLGSELGFFYLQNTMFSGDLPTKFPSGLVELDLTNTMLTGGLKGSSFVDLMSLKFLVLDGVQFNSSIPVEIANLPNLEFFFASDAMITGDLSYMESMPMIFEHWVDRNPGLSGTIPSGIGQLTTLQSFSIAGCSIEGEIPFSFGNLSGMRQLWLYNNKLVGEIPPSLGTLGILRVLEMEGNDLSGNMPDSVCERFDSGVLEVLGADCGKVTVSLIIMEGDPHALNSIASKITNF